MCDDMDLPDTPRMAPTGVPMRKVRALVPFSELERATMSGSIDVATLYTTDDFIDSEIVRARTLALENGEPIVLSVHRSRNAADSVAGRRKQQDRWVSVSGLWIGVRAIPFPEDYRGFKGWHAVCLIPRAVTL